jgi:hypothetical protein
MAGNDAFMQEQTIWSAALSLTPHDREDTERLSPRTRASGSLIHIDAGRAGAQFAKLRPEKLPASRVSFIETHPE